MRFIARVKDNRTVVLVKTGEYISVKNLPEGRHAVHLMGEKQNTVDPDVYLLIIRKHLEEKEPIRLLTNLLWEEFSDRQIVTMYLKRWGIENIFRSAETFSDRQLRFLCEISPTVPATSDPSGEAPAAPTPTVLTPDLTQAGLKTGVF